MSVVLSVQNLTKTYGELKAVNDLTFDIKEREVVGLLGLNGAGKTTTISMILGVLKPSLGVVAIEGFDIAKNRLEALQNTNFAAVYSSLPGNLTVVQNLRIFGMIYRVQNLSQRIEEVLSLFDLEKFRNTKTGLLSSGEQTRACLAKALINRPRLLLLDEPTASLDPATAQDIRAHIKAYATNEGAAVLWTSHNMYEVEEVCDRVLFLSAGQILLEGDPHTLPRDHQKSSLEDLFVSIARNEAKAS